MTFPIVQTAKATYNFVASHVVTLLRLTWLPIFINSLCSIFTTLKLLPYQAALDSGNPSAVLSIFTGPAVGWFVLGIVVQLAMNAAIAVAILRYVVHGDAGTSDSPVHVAFGWPEIRVVGVTVLIGLMVVFICIPISLGFSLVGVLTGLPVLSLVPIAAAFLLVIVVRWLLAYPIAAVENKIDFDRAWSILRPGYSRFLLLMFMVLMPMILLDIVAGVLIRPSVSDNTELLTQEIEARWMLLAATNFVVDFFFAAVFFTTIGLVYRFLTSEASLGPKGRTV